MYFIPRPRIEQPNTTATAFDPIRYALTLERAERIVARDRRMRRVLGILSALLCVTFVGMGAAHPWAVVMPCENAREEATLALWTLNNAQQVHYARFGKYSDILSEVHTPRSSENYRFTIDRARDGQSYRAYALGRRDTAVAGDVWVVDERASSHRALFPNVCVSSNPAAGFGKGRD